VAADKSVEVIPDSSHDGRQRVVDQGLINKKEESLFRHGASPFRTRADPPPRFGWQHAWGMMTWGKKAGGWGKGVEGSKKKDKNED
jgi:protein AFG1